MSKEIMKYLSTKKAFIAIITARKIYSFEVYIRRTRNTKLFRMNEVKTLRNLEIVRKIETQKFNSSIFRILRKTMNEV